MDIIIVVATVVLFIILAAGINSVVDFPASLMKPYATNKLPPPAFEEVTDEQYYDLVKRNVSDWVADAELVAIEKFDADEAKAHKIEAAYSEVACKCAVCIPPKGVRPMEEAVAGHVQQMWLALSSPPAKLSEGGVVGKPGAVTLAAGERTLPLKPMSTQAGNHFASMVRQARSNKITADTITMTLDPSVEYYSVFLDLVNRQPKGGHEVAVARQLQRLKEDDERDSYEIRGWDGTVVATSSMGFHVNAHRILRKSGIAPYIPEGAFGYAPRMW